MSTIEIVENYFNNLENTYSFEHLSSESSQLEVVSILNELADIVYIIESLRFSIKKSGKNKIYLLFKFCDNHSNICKGNIEVVDTSINAWKSLILYLFRLIKNGCKAIDELNKRLDDKCTGEKHSIDIKYRWGFGDFAEVAYWDYNSIVIKLDKTAIEKLSNGIDIEIEGLEWKDSIIDWLKHYNDLAISKQLNSTFGTNNIIELLTGNMLSDTDSILKILRSNKGKQSTQRVRSVAVIGELGLFVGILIWLIDYAENSVKVEVLDHKILDIENNAFVSEHSLYSRIENIMIERAKHDVVEGIFS